MTLRLVATSGDVQLGSLSITSNDGNEPVTTVQLAGFWQSVSEGGQEPKLAELMQIYGYGTQINIPGQQPLNQAGLVTAVGDEVLSPYWRRADPTVPVQVRQLNAFHTQGNNATLRWYPKGTTTLTALFTMEGQEAQSLLPHKNNQPTQFAAGSFAPTGAFGFKLDNEWSDDTKNNQTVDQSNGCPGPCGHHVRFWPLVDGSGNIVPNTWLMSMDYAGVNYDYNDNTFLISNMRPDDATKDPSRQALVPGAPGLVLDFDGTHPNTLVDKDGQPTGFTSTQPNRNDTTTTSDSYQSGLLDLNTAAPGTLAVTTTAGSNAGTGHPLGSTNPPIPAKSVRLTASDDHARRAVQRSVIGCVAKGVAVVPGGRRWHCAGSRCGERREWDITNRTLRCPSLRPTRSRPPPATCAPAAAASGCI